MDPDSRGCLSRCSDRGTELKIGQALKRTGRCIVLLSAVVMSERVDHGQSMKMIG